MNALPNFDLELFDYRQTNGMETFAVSVSGTSGGGRSTLDQREQVTIDAPLRERLERLARSRPIGNELLQLGLQLGRLLLPPNARDFFRRSWNKLGPIDVLRFRLRVNSPTLADLPWEICVLDDAVERGGPTNFLFLNRQISLIRDEILADDRKVFPPVEQLRLLAIMADPEDSGFDRLDLEAEERMLHAALRGVTRITPDVRRNAGLRDLEDALMKPAQIFHFAGHGLFSDQDNAGAVILVDEQGKPCSYSATQLARQLAARDIRLAVLNACDTARSAGQGVSPGVAAALLQENIPAVIGMQYRIRDDSAKLFTERLYSALVAGHSIESAFGDARRAVADHVGDGDRDWAAPTLYVRGFTEVLFPPLTSEVSRTILREQIEQHFSREELELLCDVVQEIIRSRGYKTIFSLEAVGEAGKSVQILRLIGMAERNLFLDVLIAEVRRARPGII